MAILSRFSNKQIQTAIGVIVLLLIAAGAAYFAHPQTTPISPLTPRDVSAVKVPDGWYEHEVEVEGAPPPIWIVLTKHADLPATHFESDDLYDDPEIIVSTTTLDSLSPEEYIQQYSMHPGTWGTFNGYKIFTFDAGAGRGGSANGHYVILFNGNTRFNFTLVSSSNAAQDATDFWKVIAWYAQ